MLTTLILISLVLGCSRVSIQNFPSLTLPVLPKIDLMSSGGQTTTPRPLISARLINPQDNTNAPKITVGKLIEFAERGHSCQCASDRFVKEWKKTKSGFNLKTNSKTTDFIQFSCDKENESLSCYVQEIDRGANVAPLSDRYLSGSKFIEETYLKGRSCSGTTSCP